jgi:hypothetical protein
MSISTHMKAGRKLILILWVCAVMLASGAHAQFLFVTSNNVVTITGYTGSNSTVVVPKRISGLPVALIGASAFASMTNLTSVTLPDTVTTIYPSAFYNCSGLTNITLGNGLTTIGNYAFEYCSNLSNVTIPDTFRSLGDLAFAYCASLTGVYFQGKAISPSGSPFYSDSHAVVYYLPWTTGWGATFGGLPTASYLPSAQFNYTINYGFGNATITITGYTGSGGMVTIPSTIYDIGTSNFLPVNSIGSFAFAGSTNLSSVSIPVGVTTIGNYAFQNCSSLSNVIIQDRITSFGYFAFANCTNLTSVFFGSNAPFVWPDQFYFNDKFFLNDSNATAYYSPGTGGWDFTFEGIPKVQVPYIYTIESGTITLRNYAGPGGALTIPDTIGGLPVASIGNGAFALCGSLTSVTIPDSVTELGCFAFFACSNLTSATLSTNLQYIGVSLFDSCINLTNASIPEGVFIIGASAFQNCASLGNVTIPNTVTTIGNFAFQNCASLASVAIPASVKAIPKNVFSFISGIGWDAFGACASLQSITVDPQNTNYSSLDGVLFDRNQGTLIQYPAGKYGNYVIPSSVGSIGNSAFDACAGLTGVAISSLSAGIGNWAFTGCSGLTNVTTAYECTPGYCAFESCSSLKSIGFRLPSPPSIASHSFDNCTNLTDASIYNWYSGLSLDGSVTFSDCPNLTSVYLASTYPSFIWNPTNQIATPTAYYLPGANLAHVSGLPMAPWLPRIQNNDVSFGFTTNQFGFNINWAYGLTVLVEACADLANPVWTPLATNTIAGAPASGSIYFSDPQWTNYPSRVYRIRGTNAP